jgi:hypothetical protein
MVQQHVNIGELLMRIDTQIEGTQRDLINSLARIIAGGQGYIVDRDVDMIASRNHRSKNFVRVAEQVFAVFTGDAPDYFDEDDGENSLPAPKLRKYMVFSGVEGLRVVEELAYETIAAMSDRDSRHYWSTTMFMSDETEARSVWATNPEQAIDICQLRLSARVTSSELCGAKSSESKYSLFT